ncbi:MAG: oligosaccharide flippase family protein [Dysgonamonadaceae bacterium]|jgi:O-antigen/teichoic acid export membrane protein|nr:oligosaccharide flippase family protein [Dysgonamonadaceae bacterium]
MEKNKFLKIFESEFIRNSTVLLSGNTAGQAIALLTMPVLSRLYTKDDFGLFALFTSISGILIILGTGKYEEAFVITSNRKESSALLNFSLRLLIVFCLLIFLVLWLFGSPCLSFFNMEVLLDYWYWIPLYMFFSGFFILMTYVANREKKYKIIASANLSTNGLTSMLKIAFKFLTTGAAGLISGQTVGQLFSCFSFHKLKQILKDSIHHNWQESKKAGIKFRDFPKFTMPRSFIDSFSANMPFFLLTGIFGEAQLGLFFLAFNISFRPVNLISNSIYQVLYENVARQKENSEKISSEINQYQRYCLLLALPLFVIVFIFSEWLFKTIFGVQWEESGRYFRYILPWIFMLLLTSPLGFLPLVFHKQKQHMYLGFVQFLCRLAALGAGIYFKDFNLAILLFCITGLVFSLTIQLWYRFLINNYEKKRNDDSTENH